jgi:hypothetical protein
MKRSVHKSDGDPMRLPDFIIGGAPRSGTTWLYELLARHPQVHMAQPVKPEPKFFLLDDLYDRGLAYYSRWFANAEPGQVVGEKSTNYLESATAAKRIHDSLPHVRLVFILRNPVERAYNNYMWTRMNGLETADFETALRLESARERELAPSLRYARPFSYFSRGLYADLLEPWLDLFPRHQLHIIRFEDIREDPAGLAVSLERFLGIHERAADAVAAAAETVNAAEGEETPMPENTRRRLAAAYEEPNRRLAALLGTDLWRRANG